MIKKYLLSFSGKILINYEKIYSPEQGLEPWTFRLKAWRSTNWATRAVVAEEQKFNNLMELC